MIQFDGKWNPIQLNIDFEYGCISRISPRKKNMNQ